MDTASTGKLIYTMRKSKGLTQRQLADRMGLSDKTVSKWERGLGCPDISLLAQLSHILDVDLESLLSGRLDENDIQGGNMKKIQFYVCPCCGNLMTALADSAISCCGKKLTALEAKKADDKHLLTVEKIENDYFISSEHEMTKSHYISFVALACGDAVMIRKQYPEWNLQIRIPRFAHGKLFWFCTQHGLFYQNI